MPGMKQVKLTIGKGGVVKIDAHGQEGAGTAEFTERLANDLGKIEERHICHDHEHIVVQKEEHDHDTVKHTH